MKLAQACNAVHNNTHCRLEPISSWPRRLSYEMKLISNSRFDTFIWVNIKPDALKSLQKISKEKENSKNNAISRSDHTLCLMHFYLNNSETTTYYLNFRKFYIMVVLNVQNLTHADFNQYQFRCVPLQKYYQDVKILYNE